MTITWNTKGTPRVALVSLAIQYIEESNTLEECSNAEISNQEIQLVLVEDFGVAMTTGEISDHRVTLDM